ncbi:8474_t:CDS:2 [Rhizophagus irregularis]|nr:8474_t:CDS:2 [Rhizophagus irregularis]
MVVSFLGRLLFSDAFSVNIRNNNLISDVKIEDLKFLIYREISDEFKVNHRNRTFERSNACR